MIYPERLPKSNLHTHTVYCDGKNTPDEIVLTAIDLGMECIGFSGHSEPSIKDGCGMAPEEIEKYRADIARARDLYGDRVRVLCGIEQDYFADLPVSGYEYVIGSVHYVKKDGELLAVDHSPAYFTDIVKKYGDVYRFARDYYELCADVTRKTGCDIVGHFDLFSKFNEDESFFTLRDPRYLRPAIDALDALLEKDVRFEINTGAMSRGYRRTPYPALPFLHRIAERRGRVILSSDAHSKEHLLYAFGDALEYLRVAGIGSVDVMTRDGWKTFSV